MNKSESTGFVEKTYRQEHQLELNSSQEDAMEVGTQMMVSRANLGVISNGVPQSPNASKAVMSAIGNKILENDKTLKDSTKFSNLDGNNYGAHAM